jgi:hypothetical protein
MLLLLWSSTVGSVVASHRTVTPRPSVRTAHPICAATARERLDVAADVDQPYVQPHIHVAHLLEAILSERAVAEDAFEEAVASTFVSAAASEATDSRLAADTTFEYATLVCERMAHSSGEAVTEEDFVAFQSVPHLLRTVFDADFEHYRELCRPSASIQQLRCLRPTDSADYGPSGPNIRGDNLMSLETEAGRVCLDGACTDACSRVVVPTFATHAECEELCRLAPALMGPLPDGESLSDDECALAGNPQLGLCECAASGDPRTTLLFVRLVERLRRAVAYEYGLELASVAPHTMFFSRWAQQGACGSGTPVHGDEAACPGFHYSAVIHLNTKGRDFEGGDFVFSDARVPSGCGCNGQRADGECLDCAEAAATPLAAEGVFERGEEAAASEVIEKSTAGRQLTRLSPQRGRAVFFTSGWENLHYVDVVSSGVRHAMPTFFVTREMWAQSGPDDQRGAVEPDTALGAHDVCSAAFGMRREES